MTRKTNIIRIHILAGILVVIALSITTRLYVLQVVHGDAFLERAYAQYTRPTGDSFDRGSIYFRTKDGSKVSAATLRKGYVLAVNPAGVVDPEATYEALEPFITLDEETFLDRATRVDDPYEEIERRLDESVAERIDALNLPGVNLYSHKWRYYPGEERASSVIGFVAYDEDTLTGRYGIEKFYNDMLSRGEEGDLYVNFFAEALTVLSDTISHSKERGKADIVLTIEPSVQSFVEKELKEISSIYNSEQTMAIVMDPMTGEIIAMAVDPNFNLNNFSSVEDPLQFGNPLVEGVYEMGSIFKPLTMAAGLDTGVVDPSTTYNDKGSINIDGYTISNYDEEARGVTSMQEVLSQSLNLGASFVVDQLGNKRFADYVRAYGFNDETGVDLPGEISGLLDNLDSPRDIEYRTASFGQGIAVTPISIVRALAALGNGGKLVTPHVVDSLEYTSGLSRDVSYEGEERQILDPRTSERISRMLTQVVDEALLGGTVAKEAYSIAAKTGTAQIAHPEGGYYDDRYLHSFFGYFPSYDPEFFVFLMTIEPQGVRYASQTLTEPFFNITDYLINYYDIPPDRGPVGVAAL